MTHLPSRRRLLGGTTAALGLTLLPFAPSDAIADDADARVIILSDLHSAYRRSAAIVAAVARTLAEAPGVPTLIAINGDIFERGNVVALRSGGTLDRAFLAALRALAPVVVNLGNHEAALVDDLADTVGQLRDLDIVVLSNILDKRRERPFTEASATLAAGPRAFRLVGIGTDEMMTYRQPVRDTLTVPEPAAWARSNLPGLLQGADLPVVLSHAGVMADKGFLASLPAGTLLVGGHEHLTFLHGETNGTRYVHVGSWNRGFAVATLSSSAARRRIDVALRTLPADAPADPGLAEMVARVEREHLTDEDRRIVARLAAPLPLAEAGRVLARAMARATQSHVGIMSHTTLGTGLPAGPVTAHDLAAFIRFDGAMFTAEVDGVTLAGIYALANQDGDLPLEARRGDFVYMNHEPVGPNFLYRIVTNGWTQLPANRRRYLGRDDIRFTEVPEQRLRAMLAAQLPN